MKIKELIYQTPEMSEEKLLELIDNNLSLFILKSKTLVNRIKEIHHYSDSINKLILKEFDLIQDKKSLLTKSQRTMVTGFVGMCLIEMTKCEENGSNRNE